MSSSYEEIVEEWIGTFQKWMSGDDPDSDMLIDSEDWNIQTIKEKGIMMITHETVSLDINITIKETFAELTVYTGIETAIMKQEHRLKLYRDLLLMNNETALMKFTLKGREEEIAVRTDLDLSTLGKKEFNNAVVSLLIGMDGLKEVLGVKEDDNKVEAAVNFIIVALEKGWTKEKIIRNLITHLGISEEDAIRVVTDVIRKTKEDPPERMYT